MSDPASPISIHLAYEGDVDGAVLRKLLASSRHDFIVDSVISRCGYGYLKKKIEAINNSAAHIPFLVLTDLDTQECAPSLIKAWLPQSRNPHLLFRVAVRQVESWLLADTKAMAQFLSISVQKMPKDYDELPHPKRELVNLARQSSKTNVREMAPKVGASASIGRSYVAMLLEFIRTSWNPQRAADNSDSLLRTLRALDQYAYSRA